MATAANKIISEGFAKFEVSDSARFLIHASQAFNFFILVKIQLASVSLTRLALFRPTNAKQLYHVRMNDLDVLQAPIVL